METTPNSEWTEESEEEESISALARERERHKTFVLRVASLMDTLTATLPLSEEMLGKFQDLSRPAPKESLHSQESVEEAIEALRMFGEEVDDERK